MKTTADCYRALLDGKKLIYSNVSELTYLRDGNQFYKSKYKDKDAPSTYSFSEPEYWSIYEEPHEHTPIVANLERALTDTGAMAAGILTAYCAKCGVKLKATWSPASET